jgi:hypothetical protein
MAMDTNKFEAIKNKARKMIHEDAKQDSHIIKARQADRNNPAFFRDQPSDAYSNVSSFSNDKPAVNESYLDESDNKFDAAMENQMKLYMSKKQAGQQVPIQQQQMPTAVNKNLPKEILESFSNNYIDQSVFDPNKSVLDKLGIGGDPLQQQNESVQPTRQAPANGGKVDYEIIKGIVEGAVKKYVNALGKKMLAENKNTTLDEINAIQITDKKIAIVTKSGNLYEGKLSFVKNIKGE